MMQKGKVKRFIWGVALSLLLITNLIIPVWAEPALTSNYYVLMDAATGQVLSSKNMDEGLAPAGLVKLMTALIAIEENTVEGAFVDKELSVTGTALAPLSAEIRNIGLKSGERIKLSDLIYAMLLVSANDAANVIAESIGGSLDDFVAMMNQKAVDLKLQNTYFVNANGLTVEGQKMSPLDIALILKRAFENTVFTGFFGKTLHTISPTNLQLEDRIINTTCLMHRNSNYYYEGSTGGLIGNTSASKYVIATTAQKDGRHLIAVVMKAESDASLYGDAKLLLDHGFNGFRDFAFSVEDLGRTIPVTQDGVKVGEASFTISEPVNILLSNDYNDAYVVAVSLLPSAIPKGSEGIYYADIKYKPDATTEVLLLSGIPMVMNVTLDPIPTGTGTEQTGVPITDTNGNVVTDENGNIITEIPTGTTGEPGGFVSGLKKFIKTFFIILLIIIGIAAGLILLFILVLFIIKYVKRYRRRKARARARAEAQRRNGQNNHYN